MTGFRGWRLLLLLPLVGLAVFLMVRQRAPAAVVLAAPNVFSGPVEGGCYQATRTTCSVHIDSWQPIAIGGGQRLRAVQLQANGLVVYDFRTDVSNPPAGSSYRPSAVRQDFAARCGQSYVLTLLAQDTGDAGLVVVGQTNAFTCPAYAADAFAVYAPMVVR